MPKSIEGLWDLINKLGFPLSYNQCQKFIFALSMGLSLLLMRKYENDIPESYSKLIKMLYVI